MRMKQQSTQWRCLDESEPSARLNRQMKFLRKYWYAIAIAPFAVIVFLGLRFFGDSSSRLWDIPIAISLAWGLFVAIYGLILTVHTLSIPAHDVAGDSASLTSVALAASQDVLSPISLTDSCRKQDIPLTENCW